MLCRNGWLTLLMIIRYVILFSCICKHLNDICGDINSDDTCQEYTELNSDGIYCSINVVGHLFFQL